MNTTSDLDAPIHNGLSDAPLFFSLEVHIEFVISAGHHNQFIGRAHPLPHIFKVINGTHLGMLTNDEQGRRYRIYSYIISILNKHLFISKPKYTCALCIKWTSLVRYASNQYLPVSTRHGQKTIDHISVSDGIQLVENIT